MSKQNKHTPWAYYPTGKIMQGYSQPFVIAEAGKTNLIAGIFGDTVGGLETAEANARLIAAAPDLLAVLKELIADADPEGHGSVCVEETCTFRSAHLAIAKAEGRDR